jgi:hypothetical protein
MLLLLGAYTVPHLQPSTDQHLETHTAHSTFTWLLNPFLRQRLSQ